MNLGDAQGTSGVAAALEGSDDDGVDPHLNRIRSERESGAAGLGAEDSDEEVFPPPCSPFSSETLYELIIIIAFLMYCQYVKGVCSTVQSPLMFLFKSTCKASGCPSAA
jgi:hypothetical protein